MLLADAALLLGNTVQVVLYNTLLACVAVFDPISNKVCMNLACNNGFGQLDNMK
jgi:hypothetical protein